LNPVDIAKDATVGDKVIAYLVKNQISPSISLSTGDLAVVKVKEASDLLKASITSDTNLSASDRMGLSFTMDTMLVSCFFDDVQCYASDFKVISIIIAL
jgi:hypothetical protein